MKVYVVTPHSVFAPVPYICSYELLKETNVSIVVSDWGIRKVFRKNLTEWYYRRDEALGALDAYRNKAIDRHEKILAKLREKPRICEIPSEMHEVAISDG